MPKVYNLIPCGVMTFAGAIFYGAETHEWVGATALVALSIILWFIPISWSISKWLNNKLFPGKPGDAVKGKRWGNNGRIE